MRFKVDYLGNAQWSFDVDVYGIKRFKLQNLLSHLVKGIHQVRTVIDDIVLIIKYHSIISTEQASRVI
ncbi:hypothetical protein KUL156_18510 [Alteromonas sp. KUL156]|nr:hypothetical protein KUL154_44970 [Alteromonas sp. KUL154]GFD99258.1 hypothetical protein KUL156_18510 [Alteromonas sp. KUL156]